MDCFKGLRKRCRMAQVANKYSLLQPGSSVSGKKHVNIFMGSAPGKFVKLPNLAKKVVPAI